MASQAKTRKGKAAKRSTAASAAKKASKAAVNGATGSGSYSQEELLEMFRQMYLIRQFEVACGENYAKGNIRGFLHLYIGQEATGVGQGQNLGNLRRRGSLRGCLLDQLLGLLDRLLGLLGRLLGGGHAGGQHRSEGRNSRNRSDNFASDLRPYAHRSPISTGDKRRPLLPLRPGSLSSLQPSGRLFPVPQTQLSTIAL